MDAGTMSLAMCCNSSQQISPGSRDESRPGFARAVRRRTLSQRSCRAHALSDPDWLIEMVVDAYMAQ